MLSVSKPSSLCNSLKDTQQILPRKILSFHVLPIRTQGSTHTGTTQHGQHWQHNKEVAVNTECEGIEYSCHMWKHLAQMGAKSGCPRLVSLVI